MEEQAAAGGGGEEEGEGKGYVGRARKMVRDIEEWNGGILLKARVNLDFLPPGKIGGV